MRISTKGRYALAAMIELVRQQEAGSAVSVTLLAANLGISKIYLEQVLSQLKNADVIYAQKGSKGGYQLARHPKDITAFDILGRVESVLAVQVEETVSEHAPDIEMTLKDKVFQPLDTAIRTCLSCITLQDLCDAAQQQHEAQSFMLNI